jgi:hypothetical protein
MNYAFGAIGEAASQVYKMRAKLEIALTRTGSRLAEVFAEEAECAVKDLPNKPKLHTAQGLIDSTLKTMSKCQELLFKASICARHAEWLQSDDIGYVTFCERVERDLAKADKVLAEWEEEIDD